MGPTQSGLGDRHLSTQRASPDDLAIVTEILTQAAIRQADKREAVWTVALCCDDGIWEEPDTDAGYVHRLAVRRAAGGDGFGATILAWAAEQVAHRGRTWLRLDCPVSNGGLRAYYERLGFQLVREVLVASSSPVGASMTWRLALQQRRASETAAR